MKKRKDPSGVELPESKDPMELWVGTWMPEDVIDRETRRLAAPATSDDDPSRSE